MPHAPVFICRCPFCDKRNQKSIMLLSQKTRCDHCQKTFVAEDDQARSAASNDPIYYWIRFTENAFGLGAEEDQPAEPNLPLEQQWQKPK